jgi:hypothetical protein
MEITREMKTQFDLLHTQYVEQVNTWKREWLRESPPTELVHHLTNPSLNTQRRQEEWDRYVIHRADEWWKERGWKIIWGLPHEGCHFEPIEISTEKKVEQTIL